MKAVFSVEALALVLLALCSPGAEAQTYGSIGVGAAKPIYDLGDLYDTGYTVRGQVGYSLTILDLHLQTGYTTFPSSGDSADLDDLTIYHAGVGARLSLGLIWVGANAAHFFGNGEKGVGFFPELGLQIWRLEGVVDFRVDGDEKWGATWVAFRF